MRKITLMRFVMIVVVAGLTPIAMAQSSTSIGDIANTLLQPTALVTKLLLLTCYIVGVALILMAFAQYKVHRQSPKLVPLSTPVILLFLGIVALLIPYVTNQFETGNAEKVVEKSDKPTLLPLPEETPHKGPGLPLPSREGEVAPPPSIPKETTTAPSRDATSVDPYADQGSGNWTDDPRYR